MVSLDFPFMVHPLETLLLFIDCLIYFKVSFNQAFLKSAANLVNYRNILSSGIKCNTSDPDDSKVGNALFISFTTV